MARNPLHPFLLSHLDVNQEGRLGFVSLDSYDVLAVVSCQISGGAKDRRAVCDLIISFFRRD